MGAREVLIPLEHSCVSRGLTVKTEAVLILDFGGQYTHLIARRIRELHVYSEVVPCDISPFEIENLRDKFEVKGLIMSGGPSSIYAEGAPTIHKGLLKLNLPILGICYGHQLLATLFGCKVRRGEKQEYGVAIVDILKPIGILKGLEKQEKVWMSHGDVVAEASEEVMVTASTPYCPIAAFQHKSKPIYGLQWHPEVTHTVKGMTMLRNFVFDVCRYRGGWRAENLINECISEIKNAVRDGKAIIALSGGIDSGTAAVLAAKALGNRLTAIFVDHGFMRIGETQSVKEAFKKLGVNVTVVDAKERFLKAIAGVTDPEEKRRIIGREFIRVFEEEARKVGAQYLIQGTIYPDRIESGFRRHSDKIKTHHNVAGLPIEIEFKGIIEPLKDLYKDEVRMIAKELGMPDELVWRQPFPGPGLAVRIVGEVTKEKLEVLKRADKIVSEEVEAAGLSRTLWQYFAVLTNTRTTGVKGDARTYGLTVAIRIVKSREAMTAEFARVPYELLEKISTRIVNEIPEVNRVVYDITHKPPATIEWE